MKRHLTHALGVLRSNASIVANSGLLVLGSVLAAGLGFVYWWFAAREFPPAAVGAQSALISTMAFVGMLGDAGFGTLLLGETGARGPNAHSLIAAAAVAATCASLLLAVLTAGTFTYEHWMTESDALLFAVGCALVGLASVIDNSFIGLGHSRLQFTRSLFFSVLKLILLVAVGLFTQAASAILLTCVVSLAITLAISCGRAWAQGVLRLVKPDLRGLANEVSTVINHHLLNLSSTAPVLLLPLLVSICLGPAVNAAFYIGWLVRGLAILVPASLTTVLFSLDNSEPDVMRAKIRFSLIISLAGSVVGLLGFLLFGGFMLRIFNRSYPALAGTAMPMFGISLIGGTLRLHYVLLARVKRKMLAGAFWLSVGGGAELVLAALGGVIGGVRWFALGWVFGLSVTSGFLILPLFAYLRPAAQAASPVGPAAIQRAVAADAVGRRNQRIWGQR